MVHISYLQTMTTKGIIQRVKQIELKTLKKTNSVFLGEYHSSFKGRGMTFSEIRPYQFGDDVRKMDWNKTARFNEPFVKIFEEERELMLMLLVDVSASMHFGTVQKYKRELVAELCATLGFSAIKNNDKVGLILFSDKVETFIPPKKGKSHILRIIRELVDFQPKKAETNFDVALDFFLNTIKRKSIAFLISDFEGNIHEKTMKIAAKKHDLTAIRIYDDKEKQFPDVGLLQVQDLDTGKWIWVNTSSVKTRRKYEEYYLKLEQNIKSIFKNSGAGFLNIETDDDYYKMLLNYFKTHNNR